MFPVDIAPYLFKEKLINAAVLFLALKLNGNSKFTDEVTALKRSEEITGLKYRTLRKHFDTLIAENWVGRDQYDNFYLRSFRFIRTKYKSKIRRNVNISNTQLKKFKSFLVASFISSSLKDQETLNYIYRNKRKKSRVSVNSEDAGQRDEFLTTTKYFGMSSLTLGAKLGISRSYAQKLLKEAKKHRYVKIRRHTQLIASNISSVEINHLKKTGLYENHKLRVRKTKKGSFWNFDVFEQLHNEIISNLNLKSKKEWKIY